MRLDPHQLQQPPAWSDPEPFSDGCAGSSAESLSLTRKIKTLQEEALSVSTELLRTAEGSPPATSPALAPDTQH